MQETSRLTGGCRCPARAIMLAVALAAAAASGPAFQAAAVAQTPDSSEKEAFEAAKELGTKDAWEAFLTSYSTGFRADLARAYIKKLSDEQTATPVAPQPTPPAPTSSATEQEGIKPNASGDSMDFPIVARSWGGIVREGPGGNTKKISSINEGDQITLMGVAEGLDNGFPWFKIAYGSAPEMGFMWGGIICAIGAERSDVFKTCPNQEIVNVQDGPPKKQAKAEKKPKSEKKPKKEKIVCGENWKLQNGRCVVNQNCGPNATRSPEGDCYCNKNYEMSGGKCAWKKNKNGFEIDPWKKPGCKGLQKQCSAGNTKACIKFEETCQVN